jgi:hypothetical protein
VSIGQAVLVQAELWPSFVPLHERSSSRRVSPSAAECTDLRAARPSIDILPLPLG